MVSSSIIRNRFRDSLSVATKALDDFCTRPDNKSLHRFRVNLKKAESVIRFFPIKAGKNKTKKLYKPVRQIFKSAGILRETGVNLSLCQQYKIKNRQYIIHLLQHEKKQTARIRRNQEKIKAILRQCEEDFSDNFKSISEKKLGDLLVKRSKLLKKGLRQAGSDVTRLHAQRKKMKRLIFVSPLIPEKLLKRTGIEIQKLTGLASLIGECHDLELFAGTLKSTSALTATEQRPLIARTEKLIGKIEQYTSKI